MNQITTTAANSGASPAKTMSSVELVAIINEMRESGCAELRHDNFMTKIEKHPGIDSPKFLGQYKDSTGRTLKCYNLPKRECELMVMSESLAVQTKVYDRMSELEAIAETPVTTTAKPVSNAMHYIDILCDSRPKLIDAGFDPDVAFRIANLAAFKETGISVLEAYTDAAPAPAMQTKKPKQGPAWTRGKEFYTVKELAELRGMSVGVINGIISRRGYQTRDSDGSYVITTKGEPMARLTASGILWMHSAA